MPPREKLDPYVSSFIDGIGKKRYRFRRGKVSIYLPPPASKDYRAAYKKAMGEGGIVGRAVEGSIGDLVSRFYRTVQFRRVSESWQRTMRQTIEPFREEYGNDLVADFRPKDIDRILENRFEQKIVDGKIIGGPASAERLREMLMRLFKLAVKLEWIISNPVEQSEPVKHNGDGFHPWDESDIAAYRKRWALGTRARLAMELMLWTGARPGDARLLAPPRNGRFRWKAAKTGKETEFPVAPQLQEAIDAMPEGTIGEETLLVNELGRAFSAKGIGNKMRYWCDEAGLPQRSAHGLRKALATRAANIGLSQQELKALGGWENDEEVRTYTKNSDRHRLAEGALAAVVEWEQTRTLAKLDAEGANNCLTAP
jgi:integrase